MNNDVKEYCDQLRKGHIQKAYKGIMTFMSELKSYLERKHSDYSTSSLYMGYMDMTYFAFCPSNIKDKNLKVAVVYLHEDCKFEIWLAAKNRKIQTQYLQLFSQINIGEYTLTKSRPGVDSIIAQPLVKQPDFDHPNELKTLIEERVIGFANDMSFILTQCVCGK